MPTRDAVLQIEKDARFGSEVVCIHQHRPLAEQVAMLSEREVHYGIKERGDKPARPCQWVAGRW